MSILTVIVKYFLTRYSIHFHTLLYSTTVLGLLIDHIDKGGHGLFGGNYKPMKYMYQQLLSLIVQRLNVRV